MTYRFDTQHLNIQQKAIVRKRDDEERRRKEESEIKNEEIKTLIVSLLKEDGPLTIHEIANRLNVLEGDILPVLNGTPHHIIKRELPEKEIVYEVSKKENK